MHILEQPSWKDNDGSVMSTDRHEILRAHIYQFDEKAMADTDYHPTYQKGSSESDTIRIATLKVSGFHNAVTLLHHRYRSGFFAPTK
jgi:hypothetical protein